MPAGLGKGKGKHGGLPLSPESFPSPIFLFPNLRLQNIHRLVNARRVRAAGLSLIGASAAGTGDGRGNFLDQRGCGESVRADPWKQYRIMLTLPSSTGRHAGYAGRHLGADVVHELAHGLDLLASSFAASTFTPLISTTLDMRSPPCPDAALRGGLFQIAAGDSEVRALARTVVRHDGCRAAVAEQQDLFAAQRHTVAYERLGKAEDVGIVADGLSVAESDRVDRMQVARGGIHPVESAR